MGNTSLKTLQEFISTLNERNIIKVSEEEIVAKTNAVHYLLKENKECLNELKQIGTNQYVGTNESGENENNQTNSNNITFYTNFCKIISSEFPSLTIIMTSLDEESDDLRNAMRAGAKDFISSDKIQIKLLDSIIDLIDTKAKFGNQNGDKRGKILTMISAKGGAGTPV